jgi:hypothetical protein
VLQQVRNAASYTFTVIIAGSHQAQQRPRSL